MLLLLLLRAGQWPRCAAGTAREPQQPTDTKKCVCYSLGESPSSPPTLRSVCVTAWGWGGEGEHAHPVYPACRGRTKHTALGRGTTCKRVHRSFATTCIFLNLAIYDPALEALSFQKRSAPATTSARAKTTEKKGAQRLVLRLRQKENGCRALCHDC